MLKKEFSLSIKEVDAGVEGAFEGYASTFGGSPDSYGDIVAPGAFAESLVKHRRDGTMPMMFFGHNSWELPIGDWLDMSEDGKGLWVKGQLAMDDPFGARVHTALKRKRVRGLSIGYEIRSSKPDEKRPGVTILEKIDLWEVSVVNFPANRRSLVEEVKAGQFGRIEELARRFRDGDPMPIKDFENVLREAGFPKSAAVAIASHGYAKALRSESVSEKANEMSAFLAALRG